MLTKSVDCPVVHSAQDAAIMRPMVLRILCDKNQKIMNKLWRFVDTGLEKVVLVDLTVRNGEMSFVELSKLPAAEQAEYGTLLKTHDHLRVVIRSLYSFQCILVSKEEWTHSVLPIPTHFGGSTRRSKSHKRGGSCNDLD